MNPRIQQVRPMADHQMEVIFENGEHRLFDLKPYLERGVFARLRSQAAFRAARVVAGSVEWPGEVDLSYDTLYLDSRPMAAPSLATRERQTDERKTPKP